MKPLVRHRNPPAELSPSCCTAVPVSHAWRALLIQTDLYISSRIPASQHPRLLTVIPAY